MNNQEKSLNDVHQSISVHDAKSKFRKVLGFFGPAYLISVGYMDPGNWATDLAGGSQFGYTLIWVLLMSNIMALLLQSLSARLGIVWGKDLAQCNRETYPRGMNFILYLLAEIAIAACDLAEILGMAIGLNLLFGLDLLWGVGISFLDTFLLLYLQRLGMRKTEMFIVSLIFLIGACFLVEMVIAKPDVGAIMQGFIPSIPNKAALYISIGIIGATVMPHNLYLHSALVQTRKINRDEASIRKALKYNFWDSAIALNLAFLINAAILILAASAFHQNGMNNIADLEDAHKLLAPTLGSEWAPRLFAVALILAGQSSTVTGTLAGQVVMEGYLRLRISPVLRRMLTRLLAIVPAVLVIYIAGDDQVGPLLIFSQVLLSMQLAFAVIPLIHFVSDKKRMGVFTISLPVKVISWLIAAIISFLNFQLLYQEVIDWIKDIHNSWATFGLLIGAFGLLGLLIMTIIYPLMKNKRKPNIEVHPPFSELNEVKVPGLQRIALALDYSISDKQVVAYALMLAQANAQFILIHIVESATSRIIGEDTDDYEKRHDEERMEKYLKIFQDKGYEAKYYLSYENRVRAITKICKENKADILIVGSHGHRGIKDFIYGETVNRLRHRVNIPVFIAQ
ncbi:Nramp family divalent metal transporter [Albibacterium sp.]|uniref:Nramp family divalent metal transporter n=1 Tax=Albibacterium sp. TaxID=2952885 RepID=UPI002C75B5A6|nr:Nramp family divalent metal transporter [Albibacterium sp.]HUH19599.1 Nramp family divalent metal transporter [Albibacterium sp.]